MKLYPARTALGVVGADIGYVDTCLTEVRSTISEAKYSSRESPLRSSDHDRRVLSDRRPVKVTAYSTLHALIKNTDRASYTVIFL